MCLRFNCWSLKPPSYLTVSKVLWLLTLRLCWSTKQTFQLSDLTVTHIKHPLYKVEGIQAHQGANTLCIQPSSKAKQESHLIFFYSCIQGAAKGEWPNFMAFQDLEENWTNLLNRVNCVLVVSLRADTLVGQELQLIEYFRKFTVKSHYIPKQKTSNLTQKGIKKERIN